MEATHDHGHHESGSGFMKYVTTTNHKDIGSMYLWFSFVMFLTGGVMALTIRAELFQPGLQLVNPEFFNQMTTLHGLIMVFGAIMPAFVGFANWQIPMMIGAPDMAFPRMNNWSFWLLPPAAILLVMSLLVPGGSAGAGWTLYPPLTIQQGMGMDLVIFAIHILGMSSIMGSINIVTTILNMRAPGMTLMKMPLFVWTWLITAYLLIAVMPVLAGAVTMTLTDRHFDTHFFNPAGGGDPVLFQHIFWFFGHPEVYIIHHSCIWCNFSGYSCFFKKTIVWICFYGLCNCINCYFIFFSLGSSYVYSRYASRSSTLLYVCHHANCCSHRC